MNCVEGDVLGEACTVIQHLESKNALTNCVYLCFPGVLQQICIQHWRHLQRFFVDHGASQGPVIVIKQLMIPVQLHSLLLFDCA